MDIDLVYLWVDGSDPAWVARKNACLPPDRQVDPQSAGACRYAENDELRYSLRSVERYAPWIRRVYIVTDGQCPAWLDTSNPRVRVVDHREILPSEVLPLFNSCAIEMALHRIPGLAEHFLYANDDTFFGAPVTPDFFFDGEGRPIVRLKKQSIRRHLDEIYPYMLHRTQQLVRERLGRSFHLAPHHNIDAMRKSDYAACLELFGEEAARTMRSRFRSRDDLQRSVLLYYALALGHARLRRVSRFNGVSTPGQWLAACCGVGCRSDSRCIAVTTPDVAHELAKYRPKLFCLNDGEGTTDEDRLRVHRLLEQLFPEKSSFER